MLLHYALKYTFFSIEQLHFCVIKQTSSIAETTFPLSNNICKTKAPPYSIEQGGASFISHWLLTNPAID